MGGANGIHLSFRRGELGLRIYIMVYISIPTYFEHFEWGKWLIGLAQSLDFLLKIKDELKLFGARSIYLMRDQSVDSYQSI